MPEAAKQVEAVFKIDESLKEADVTQTTANTSMDVSKDRQFAQEVALDMAGAVAGDPVNHSVAK